MVRGTKNRILRPGRGALAVSALVSFALGAVASWTVPVSAQGFQWPWDNSVEEPRPVPREPVYGDQPGQRPAPRVQQGPQGGWSGRSTICYDLERRLVQGSQFAGQARQKLPAIEAEIRKLDRSVRSKEAQMDRRGCYEYFLFSKSVRRTRKCLALSNTVETARRRLAELRAERQSITSSSGRSHQDEIVRELARNRCGAEYTREARRRDRGPFSGFFWDDDEGGSGYANSYKSLPFATYRTLCVRLCDGYYFPISFSTLPNHFPRDAEVCQSRCAAPAQLYFHQNPGAGVDQMVAFSTNQPYTELKGAFRYRKEYVSGCSCKQAEYLPEVPPGEAVPKPADDAQLNSPPAQQRRAEVQSDQPARP